MCYADSASVLRPWLLQDKPWTVLSYGHLSQSRKRRIRATWMVYHVHNALRKSLHSYIPPFYFTITSLKQGRLASPAPFQFETVFSEAYCAYTIQNQNRL